MWIGLALMLAMQGPSIQTIVTDAMSHVDSPRQAVARTPAEWTQLWREHAGETAAPKVDFASRTVVAVFLGTRNTAGYAVEMTGLRQDNGVLVVEWRERRPERDQISAQVITSPAHIASIAKFAGEIRFEKVAQ
jgi:PrcB C-terminal